MSITTGKGKGSMSSTPTPEAEWEELELACPACNASLQDDETYQTWRLCGQCGRHFWISARDRMTMLAGSSSVEELAYSVPVLDPLAFHDRLPAPERLASGRERSAVSDAVVVARVELGTTCAIVVTLDSALLPGGLGLVAGDKIVWAFERAAAETLPLVIVCGGGSGAPFDGVLAAFQPARIAGALHELHRTGQPMIAVLTHPTAGTIESGLAMFADIVLCEPGAASRRLPVDLTATRPALSQQLATILEHLAHRPPSGGSPREKVLPLAGSADAASIAIERRGSRNVITLRLELGELSLAAFPILARGQHLSHLLDLPLLVSLSTTGRVELANRLMAPILAHGFLRHRTPVIVLLDGTFDGSVTPLLTGDAIVATPNTSFWPLGTRGHRYPASDCLRLGLVDHVTDDNGLDALLARLLGELDRSSPGRRIDRRIAATVRRGAESPARGEAAWRELRDFHDVQVAVGRSFEEFRGRLERRQLRLPAMTNMPTLGELQQRASQLQLTMPKIQERGTQLRELITARRGHGPRDEGESS